MGLRDIVRVTINRQTKGVTQRGFGVVNIIGPNLNSSNRLEYFTDIGDVAEFLCGGEDAPEYAAAAMLLGQDPVVERIAISQVQGTKIIDFGTGTYTSGAISAEVNGNETTSVSYHTDKDTTLTDLATAIALLDDVSSAVYSNATKKLTITPESTAVLGVTVDIGSVAGTMGDATHPVLVTATATEDYEDAFDAIRDVDDSWYGTMIVSRNDADILDIAAKVEAAKKIFGIATNDTEALASDDTTSILYQLEALGYDRTFCMYSASADTSYSEAGMFGKFMQLNPGEYTVMFKTITGLASDNLTPTQSTTVLGKNGNTYEEIGGVDIIQEGTMVSGEYIDVMVFIDWLEARMSERIYASFVNNLKIPFTDAGIGTVEEKMRAQIGDGIRVGGLASSPAPIYTIPKASEVSAADKAARLLPDMKVTATLAGAIHHTEIEINVVL